MPQTRNVIHFTTEDGSLENIELSAGPGEDCSSINLEFDFPGFRHFLTRVQESDLALYERVADDTGMEWIATATREKDSSRITGSLVLMVAEQQLTQLRGIVDKLPIMVWYKDNKNTILRVNQKAAESAGLPVEALEGRPTEEIFPDMAAEYLKDDLAIIESGEARIGYIEKFAPIDKPHSWIRTDKLPFNDPVTGQKGVIAVSIDMTQVFTLQEEAEILSRRLAAASNASGVGLWEYKMDGTGNVWWSEGMYKIFGRPPADTRTFEDRFDDAHEDDRQHIFENIRASQEEGIPFEISYRLKTKSGEWRWVEAKGMPEKDENGVVVGLTGSLRDVTEQKKAETLLKSQMKKLEWANERLDSFNHVAAHDLKSPMRGMVNLISWIEEELDEEALNSVSHLMEMLRSRIHRLETLLEDLGAYSRAGQDESEMAVISLDDHFPRLIRTLDSSKSIELDILTALPKLNLPKSAANHMFLNIFSNAAKHVPYDKIILKISAEESEYDIKICFEDNGPGIAAEYRDKVFQPFKTLKSRDDVEGSGIGLSIVRRLVEDSEGKVEAVEPVHGTGARIVFTFPKDILAD